MNQDKQKISLKGYYSLNSKSNLVFSASDINIKDLSRAYLTKLPDKNLINGNIKYFNIKYEGTLKDPNILVEVSTDNVKFDTNNVGYLYAIVKYKDNFLNPDIVLIDPVTNGKLLITGKIPFNNPIVTDTLDLDLLNKKIN